MGSSIAIFKGARLLPMLCLGVASAGLRTIEPPSPILPEGFGRSSPPASFVAMFGGLRAVVAGGCWLRANLAWERRDAEATRWFIEATVAADDRPAYFWVNGARMLACDLPTWQPPGAGLIERQAASNIGVARALAFLEKGILRRGPDPVLYIEMARLHLQQRGDLAKAGRCFRIAAEQPGAPYYAGRIYADLLVRQGKPAEALVWLQALVRHLPAGDPEARRAVVLARIAALETELAGR